MTKETKDSLNSREILKAVTLIDNEKWFFMEMNEDKRDKKWEKVVYDDTREMREKSFNWMNSQKLRS